MFTIKSFISDEVNFLWVMTYCNFVGTRIRGTYMQATSRHVIVYFSIILHGGCKFVIEGF